MADSSMFFELAITVWHHGGKISRYIPIGRTPDASCPAALYRRRIPLCSSDRYDSLNSAPHSPGQPHPGNFPGSPIAGNQKRRRPLPFSFQRLTKLFLYYDTRVKRPFDPDFILYHMQIPCSTATLLRPNCNAFLKKGIVVQYGCC